MRRPDQSRPSGPSGRIRGPAPARIADCRPASRTGPASTPTAPPIGRPATSAWRSYTLQVLTDRAPGHSVEVRIPPFAAVQAIPGPVHRRGTPSAVVEMDAATWLALATGTLSWARARSTGRIRASGERADLTPWLPLGQGLTLAGRDAASGRRRTDRRPGPGPHSAPITALRPAPTDRPVGFTGCRGSARHRRTPRPRGPRVGRRARGSEAPATSRSGSRSRGPRPSTGPAR